MTEQRREHWDHVYRTKDATEVSWFQPEPTVSIEAVQRSGFDLDAAILDVGAGASRLVDGLLALGYRDITLLDVSEAALGVVRDRLRDAALGRVQYVAADITEWQPERKYPVWHDRAVYHFLVDPADRAAYRRAVDAAVPPGGAVVLGTFALDGPEKCSGLPVQRHSVESLQQEFEDLLRVVETRTEKHTTPSGGTQSFLFVRFVRPL